MMDDHERQREEIAAYVLGRLDVSERARVEAHVRECAACARLLREYESVLGLLPYGLPRATPPPEARQVVLQRIRAHQRTMPEPAKTVVQRRLVRWSGATARWAAAALLFVALLGWNVWLQLVVSNQSAAISQLAGATQNQATLLINTAAAPGASGRLILAPNQQRGVLLVSGLPVPPANREYQFWFARPDKSRDSAAVFQVGANGEALINITTPGELSQYDQVWITLEPAGGSAVPTPPHFLEGPL